MASTMCEQSANKMLNDFSVSLHATIPYVKKYKVASLYLSVVFNYMCSETNFIGHICLVVSHALYTGPVDSSYFILPVFLVLVLLLNNGVFFSDSWSI